MDHHQDTSTIDISVSPLPNPATGGPGPAGSAKTPGKDGVVMQIIPDGYTLSHLVFFSLVGTLARLGLQASTAYPRAPVTFPSVWPNFGGSLIIGFVVEGQAQPARPSGAASRGREHAEAPGSPELDIDVEESAVKKQAPLLAGLTTGFCGSLTSFSAFVRDLFLALSDGLGNPNPDGRRGGGLSFMAFAAVLLATISLSFGGFRVGVHMAIACRPVLRWLRRTTPLAVIDRVVVAAAWGGWAAAIALCAAPPEDRWRGQALFALTLAPIGTVARVCVSRALNGRSHSFPLGTFAVNVAGTGILAASWDLAHTPLGGVLTCQVLQGIQDGFCGCLTTVSTWVAELTEMTAVRVGLDAYIYATVSVVASLAVAVAVMGGMAWGSGFAQPLCVT